MILVARTGREADAQSLDEMQGAAKRKMGGFSSEFDARPGRSPSSPNGISLDHGPRINRLEQKNRSILEKQVET